MKDYQRHMDEHLRDWKEREFSGITRQEVTDLHLSVSKTSPARADGMGRFIRALSYFAKAAYKDDNGESLLPKILTEQIKEKNSGTKLAGKNQL